MSPKQVGHLQQGILAFLCAVIFAILVAGLLLLGFTNINVNLQVTRGAQTPTLAIFVIFAMFATYHLGAAFKKE